jgi:hypothetical protein
MEIPDTIGRAAADNGGYGRGQQKISEPGRSAITARNRQYASGWNHRLSTLGNFDSGSGSSAASHPQSE